MPIKSIGGVQIPEDYSPVSLATRHTLAPIAREQIKLDKDGLPEIRFFHDPLSAHGGPQYACFKLMDPSKVPSTDGFTQIGEGQRGTLDEILSPHLQDKYHLPRDIRIIQTTPRTNHYGVYIADSPQP